MFGWLPALPQSPSEWRHLLLLRRSASAEEFRAFVYDHIALISVINTAAMLLTMLCTDITYFWALDNQSTAFLLFATVLTIVQLVSVIVAHIGMAHELRTLYGQPSKVAYIYFSIILTYAQLYMLCFAYDRTSFNIDGYSSTAAADPSSVFGVDSDTATTNNLVVVYLYLCYFSTATITSTGFGDIAPLSWWTSVLCNVQMLTGMIYHVGVFGLTLTHFTSFQAKVAEEVETADIDDATIVQVTSDDDNMPSLVRAQSTLWSRLWSHATFVQLQAFCVRHMLLLSIGVQLLTLAILFSFDDPFDTRAENVGVFTAGKIAALVFCGTLITAQFAIVLSASIQLVQTVSSNTISVGFLCQSYVSTALLFSACYTFLFASTTNHEFSRTKDLLVDPFDVIVTFIYFSFTVITGTGFGDIYGRGVLARLAVMCEMMISILYGFIIVGLGMATLISRLDAMAEQKLQQKQQPQEAVHHSSRPRSRHDSWYE